MLGNIAVAGRIREYLRTKEIGYAFNSMELQAFFQLKRHGAVSAELYTQLKRGKLSRRKVVDHTPCKNGKMHGAYFYEYTLLTHDFGIHEGRGPTPGGKGGHKRKVVEQEVHKLTPDMFAPVAVGDKITGFPDGEKVITYTDAQNVVSNHIALVTKEIRPTISSRLLDMAVELEEMSKQPTDLSVVSTEELLSELRKRLK